MGKIRKRVSGAKHRFRDMSLRSSYIVYMLCTFLAVTLLCSFIVRTAENYSSELYFRYRDTAQEYVIPAGGRYVVNYIDKEEGILSYRIFDNQGQRTDTFNIDLSKSYPLYTVEGTQHEQSVKNAGNLYTDVSKIIIMPLYSDADQALDIILRAVSALTFPVFYALAAIICFALFYHKKLRHPIELLNAASARIAANDLNFNLRYERQDEMGKLCTSFEKMRAALAQNNKDTWRQIEERKRLNAAFSHDLRTPLTVLKGHTGMLLSGIPGGIISQEEIIEELLAMSGSIRRLENYVEAMASLQRLEDVEIHRRPTPAQDFVQSLYETASILCTGKKLQWHCPASKGSWNIDPELVMQVYENLLTNAARYAKTTLEVTVYASGYTLFLLVSDDGPGFARRTIAQATNPFYKANENADSEHLGLGLHICKILCERQDGSISISNNSCGGGFVCASFGMK